MAALEVGVAGQVLMIPGSVVAGSRDITEVFLYLSVTRVTNTGAVPVPGLTGVDFSVKLFTTPTIAVDVPTMFFQIEVDENGQPNLDGNGKPIGQLVSLLQTTGQPGVYFLGGAVPGLSAQAFVVSVQAGADQGKAVGPAGRFGPN